MAAKKMMKKASPQASAKSSSGQNIHGEIQKKAFELFEKRGYAHGNDLSDWLEAEKIVKGSKR